VPVTRRKFLQQGALLAGAAVMHHHPGPSRAALQVRPALDPNSLTRFVDPLPLLPVARPAGTRPSPADAALKIPYYRIAMRPFETNVHRDLKPTRMWGFDSVFPGPTIEVRSGQEILVEWANELPDKHFLPIDNNLTCAGKDQPEVRAVVHLHGAKAPPESDGYPLDWILPGKSALYRYPNQQDAAMLWYHDHAMGINRLNIFAGLFGAYILRDDVEDALNLPRGKYEIPLIVSDRMFDKEGQLYYPVAEASPGAPWIPEFFGDANLVNGKLFPFLDVEPRSYRFRLLNGSNARFYRFGLSNKDSFQIIGSDQGLLDAPVPMRKFVIAPAERVDLVLDFSSRAGENIVVMDDAVAVMQFRVAPAAVSVATKSNGGAKSIATAAAALPEALRPVARTPESAAIKTRQLSLDEVDDLVQNPVRLLLNNSRWDDPITENPVLGSTEIWTLVNPTDDVHPIHLHLVRFQILDRRRFETFGYLTKKIIRFTGEPELPEPFESGWKDTVRANPGMVTRIIVRFDGYPGRYVWHCHILEHEDNEMMRPYQVLPAPKA
jgi:spore coat protein A